MELIEQEKTSHKKTELGLIPKDWNLEQIDEFAKIKTGDKDTQDRLEEGLYPFYVRSQKVESINSFSFDGEAVLTSGDGVGVGKIYHYLNGRFDYHQRVYNIHNFRNDVSGKYFYYYFSNHFYERVMSMTAKSSVDSVRREMISEMKIPLPPTLEEQKAIATALSDMDALIAGLEKLIAKKKAIKQGAMQQLLTPPSKGGKRLLGFSGEWEEKRLGECLLEPPKYGIGAAATDFDLNLPTYLRITDIDENGYLIKNSLKSVDHGDSSKYYLEKNDIVFARTGASVGKSYLYNENDGDLVYAGFLIKCKVNPEILNPFFLRAFVSTAEYWNWVITVSMRSGQPGINSVQYSKMEFFLPHTVNEQNAISEILINMSKEIAALGSKKAKYEQVKQGMMQELLTGKTRLV